MIYAALTMLTWAIQATHVERTLAWDDNELALGYEIIMSTSAPDGHIASIRDFKRRENRITTLWPRGCLVTVIVSAVYENNSRGRYKLTGQPFYYDVPKEGAFHSERERD